MAAHGAKLDTLKQCLEFLYWLNNKKQDVARTRMAGRLYRLLDGKYIGVNQNQIANALSQFLSNVSNFYEKLCNSPKAVYDGETKTKPALNYLLVCIPKVLSVMYFLQYHVDKKFSALGGGDWADLMVGQVAMYTSFAAQLGSLTRFASKIDEYFIENDKEKYGVIPGGFAPDELKPGHLGKYNEGNRMLNDLQSISNKHSDRQGIQNYILDLFSTSVIPTTAGTQISNVANALRLVQDFCRIFEKVENKEDFEKYLYLKDRCMNWQELKDHCKKLKVPLENIFKRGRFSFTGYAREDKYLNSEKFSKKMASWFRANLDTVRNALSRIQPFSRIKKINRSSFRKGRPVPTNIQRDISDYFGKNFFRYGFTFHGHDFNTWNNTYEVFTKEWDGAINELNKGSDGLGKLVDILNGDMCKIQEVEKAKEKGAQKGRAADKAEDGPPEPQAEESKDESDVESEDEDDEQLLDEEDPPPTKTEATKTEAAKPVVTKSAKDSPSGRKAEGTPSQSKKAEGAQNQDKKSEGAQNQAKEAEGAQNQGKKVEGAQNQGKKAEQDSPASSPQSMSTQPSSISDSAADPSGASGPGGGSKPDFQGSVVDAQSSSQVATANRDDGSTAAVDTSSGSGGTGGGEDSDRISHQQQNVKASNPLANNCGDGKAGIPVYNDQGYICQANRTRSIRQYFEPGKPANEKMWNSFKAKVIAKETEGKLQHKHKKQEAQRKNREALKKYKNQLLRDMDIETKVLNQNTERPKYPGVAKLEAQNEKRNAKNKLHDIVQLIQPPPAVKVEGNPLPNNTKPIAGKQWEDEKFKMLVQRGNILHGSAIKQSQNQSHTSRPLKHRKQSQPLPAITQKDYRSITPSVMQGAPVVQIPQRTPKEINKPPPVEVLDGHTFAFQQQLNGTDMTNSSITDEPVTLFENITPPLPPVLVSGNKIPDPKLNAPLPPLPTVKTPDETSGTSSTPPVTVPVDDQVIRKMLNVSGTDLTKPHEKDLNGCEYEGIDPPVPRSVFGKSPIPDPNLKSSPIPAAMFLPEPHPTLGMDVLRPYVLRDNPDFFDLQIDVPKLTLPDNDLDFNLDFDDDSTHIRNETLPDPVDPPFPAVSFNIAPPDVEQSMPPPQDFDPEIIHRPELKMCISSWATSTPTPGATDIPETDLSPAEAPRTVRDMLQWLAGLKHEKHHKTLEKCISKAFGGPHKDPSQLAVSVNGSYVRPKDVFDILQLTAMFTASVLNSIAPNWKANVSSRTVQLKSSTKSQEPDCCALLCQLRDYVYACCHQLQFLKAQCNRVSKHSGWQDCSYGSGITSPNSPLQAFLTDGWDSDFKTHLFDLCNLCLKSRIRMGFRDKDFPKTSQLGSVISSMLSPYCGG